jgi:hypothetical protein
MTKRRLVLATTTVFLSGAIGWRAYRHVRPAGSAWSPPLFSLSHSAVDGGVYTSPDGRRLRVTFHDFGAAQSGHYWTWVIADRWLLGDRVVAEGYTSTAVRDGLTRFPVRWNPDGTFTVEFLKGRYGEETKPTTSPRNLEHEYPIGITRSIGVVAGGGELAGSLVGQRRAGDVLELSRSGVVPPRRRGTA